jgi:glycosyltransferase involved in cell wall biosynthesis
MKYKICVINSLYPPYDRGGAEKIAELTAQGLKEEGHKVFVVTSSPWRGFFSLMPKISTPTSSPYSDRGIGTGGDRGGVKIYRFFPLNLFSFANIGRHPLFFRLIWRTFDTFNLHSFLVLWYILRKEQPDIVWTHNLTGIGLLTPLLLKILQIPHIHILHDISLVEPSGLIIKGREKKNFLTRLIFSKITKKLMGSPQLVISPSKWLLDFYLKHGFFKQSRILVKQNPTPTFSPYFAEGETGGVRGGQKLNLLYIGQLEKHKGILLLISALDDFSEKYNFKLFIVGNGRLFNYLKKSAAKRPWLIVCGKLDAEDLEKVWKNSNLTVVPSLTYENSPTVIYESLTRGIPVVASRIGGIPELIKNGENGLLFEAGDKENLKKKLVQIFKDRRTLEDLSQKALTFETKSSEIYVEEILDYANPQILCQ